MGGLTMTTLSFGQLKQLAANAGFPSGLQNTMAAIALAESGGNPSSTNPFDNGGTQTSWGLWQISYGNHQAPPNWSDPQSNANLAYQKYLSQGLRAWGTYTSGKYKQYMSGSSASTGSGLAAWYTFPRIDNFGTKDPQGDFWKPDSNVQLPGGYPITALLSGTVTSLENSKWGGQQVATIKLDTPLNPLATHTYYEHMSGFAPGLTVGQHVSAGQLIGYNNPSGQVPLGFGLYSGDVYGTGSAWSTLQQDLAPGGAGYLNPVNLLNAAASSGGAGVGGYSGTVGLNTSSNCAWYDLPCWFQSQVESLFINVSFVVVGLILGLVGIIILFFGHGGEIAGTGFTGGKNE